VRISSVHAVDAGSIRSVSEDADTPGLITLAPGGPARGVVLLTHGGRSKSRRRDSHLRLPALRMLPFLADIARSGRPQGVAVAQLRYRLVGFNDGDPVRDVHWALDRLAERFDAPVCLVGHSMGARACLEAADHHSVAAVAGLAAWLPLDEPVDTLAGRALMLAHGLRDRITDPARSYAFALRARAVTDRVCRFEIAGSRHAMLDRLGLWQSLTRSFALGVLGAEPLDGRFAAAFAAEPEAGCRVLL
jgi:pimeloyl-ACP methyl ester carboxylesterase